MQDFLGNTLEAGDIIAYADGQYAMLGLARVVKPNPKTLQVLPITAHSANPRFTQSDIRKAYDQVVLLSREMQDWSEVEVWEHFRRIRQAG